MNIETKEERYNRAIRSTYNIPQSEIKELFTEGESTCYLHIKTNNYFGYCKVRQTNYMIKAVNLMELAANSEDYLSFSSNCNYSKIFYVCVMGGGFIPLSTFITNFILDHFWTQYKALTG